MWRLLHSEPFSLKIFLILTLEFTQVWGKPAPAIKQADKPSIFEKENTLHDGSLSLTAKLDQNQLTCHRNCKRSFFSKLSCFTLGSEKAIPRLSGRIPKMKSYQRAQELVPLLNEEIPDHGSLLSILGAWKLKPGVGECIDKIEVEVSRIVQVYMAPERLLCLDDKIIDPINITNVHENLRKRMNMPSNRPASLIHSMIASVWTARIDQHPQELLTDAYLIHEYHLYEIYEENPSLELIRTWSTYTEKLREMLENYSPYREDWHEDVVQLVNRFRTLSLLSPKYPRLHQQLNQAAMRCGDQPLFFWLKRIAELGVEPEEVPQLLLKQIEKRKLGKIKGIETFYEIDNDIEYLLKIEANKNE
ncbi:hypothetical protein O181_036284 [Austropuccinia psidii MF-1]|uniref:Uncharacterized protein n=1 Tax=Austropuccinia psidii MF-1 TaxID=1389203 RepID=A0A9Q3HBE2_9BASI|nr:hypothetical protein [Austropuccinia psidii MF-1]